MYTCTIIFIHLICISSVFDLMYTQSRILSENVNQNSSQISTG